MNRKQLIYIDVVEYTYYDLRVLRTVYSLKTARELYLLNTIHIHNIYYIVPSGILVYVIRVVYRIQSIIYIYNKV